MTYFAQTPRYMGTRGLAGVAGLVLGSVTTKVIALAEVPVLLVK